MSPYPPNISRRDKIRAGIIDPEVICPECGCSVKSDKHEDWCDLQELEISEIAEREAEDAQHTDYDPVEHKDL